MFEEWVFELCKIILKNLLFHLISIAARESIYYLKSFAHDLGIFYSFLKYGCPCVALLNQWNRRFGWYLLLCSFKAGLTLI